MKAAEAASPQHEAANSGIRDSSFVNVSLKAQACYATSYLCLFEAIAILPASSRGHSAGLAQAISPYMWSYMGIAIALGVSVLGQKLQA